MINLLRRKSSYYGLFCLSLISCNISNSPELMFDNYSYRLSNALASDRPKMVLSSPLISYPSRRELSYSLAPVKLGLLDFLRLSSCELQRHIGSRNSSLGRVLQPSQRLIYEVKFIELGNACLQVLDKQSALYKLLTEALVIKREQLNKRRWNALFGSDEFSVLFSLGVKPLNTNKIKVIPSELYSALDTLYRYNSARLLTLVDEVALEQAFSIVVSSKRVGEIRRSMYQASAYLEQADKIVKARLLGKALCFNQLPNDKFDVAHTVFLKFYIGEVQPYVGRLHQHAQALFERLDRLQKNSLSPKVFSRFWERVYLSESSEWQLFNAAIKQHTISWQKLLSQCGRMPS